MTGSEAKCTVNIRPSADVDGRFGLAELMTPGFVPNDSPVVRANLGARAERHLLRGVPLSSVPGRSERNCAGIGDADVS